MGDTFEGCRLAVKVQPNACKTAFAGLLGDRLKVALQAPAVDGKANRALVQFLARSFGLSKTAVRIVQGETSREKTLLLEGVRAADIRRRLTEAGLPAADLQETP